MQEMKKNKTVIYDYLAREEVLVELYNTVYDANYPPDMPIELYAEEETPYWEGVHDIVFRLDGQLVVVLVQRKPADDRFPLHLLGYTTRLYETMVEKGVLQRTEGMPLPAPHFIVLPVGEDGELFGKPPKKMNMQVFMVSPKVECLVE